MLHALRLRGPLAGDPTARMLHAFLLSVALWFAIWISIMVPAYPNPPARLRAAALQELIPLGTLVLLHLGFLRPASWFYLAGTWIWTTDVVAFNNGIHSPFLVHYVPIPIIASWLLGLRGALWGVAACE